ncbi:MAG: UMP kinase [Methanobacteriota archaeon]
MNIVFSLGGSILAPDEIDQSFLEEVTDFLRELTQKHKVYVVVGGGKIARKYQQAARKLNASDELLDWLGIYATRLNALLLSSAIGKRANRQIPQTVAEAIAQAKSKEIVVMGGTDPNHSTDAVAAEIAEKTNANLFINASNIEGVYDKDPKTNTDAKLISEMTAQNLLEKVSKIPQSPGNYALMDKMAVESIIRSKVKTIILHGHDLENLKDVINGESFTGTVIN